MDLKDPHAVPTGAVTALGLIGGWITARETGIRPLGVAVRPRRDRGGRRHGLRGVRPRRLTGGARCR